MPCLPKAPEWPAAQRLLKALLLACALLLAGALPVLAQGNGGGNGFSDMRFDASTDGVRMSGNMRFTLSDAVRDTLNRGVAVYFVFETQTTRDRWYWSDKEVFSNKRYIRLMFQPLTRRWRLNTSSEPFNRGTVGVMLNQHFNSLDEALAVVQRISSWQVLESDEWEQDAAYNVRVRFKLDVSQLRQPLQIGTVGQSGWNLALDRSFRLMAADVGKASASN
ncbi:MAG: DUF4390 domain-containing protein [Brachymonas sp.]|nr:DUF4390 domain-containing protein [Brachymonas sp.]